jgi:hypothetical protein
MFLFLATNARAQSARPSAASCDRYAHNYAKNASRQGQVLGGAAVGSLVGLGIGAIAGGAGVGAAIGGGIGAIGGGVRRSSSYNNIYQSVYRDCMAGRRP